VKGNRVDMSETSPSRVSLPRHCFSWSAVIVGALAGIGVSFLLNLLTVALGLSSFAQTATSAQVFSLGGFTVLTLVSILSMSTLGWIAGYMGASFNINAEIAANNTTYGYLYGFIAWSLALILTMFLSAHIGNFISYGVSTLSNPTTATQEYEAGNSIASNSITDDESIWDDGAVESPIAEKTETVALFVMFSLFFIGALSATIAGHHGYGAWIPKEDESSEDDYISSI